MKNNLTILLLISLVQLTFGQISHVQEEKVEIPTKNVVIKGTLLNIVNVQKSALCIIIPGSGPTDRDGNNAFMKNNSLKFLAEELAQNNIASYRYDKSVLSYSKNNTKIDSLTFNDFIEEASEVISHFKKLKKYSKIIIIGHSQGSLVGMISGKNTIDGFISIAGSGRTIDEVLTEQIELQAPFLKDETTKILTELKAGKTVENVNPMLISLFNKKVQPFLTSWIQYNPQTEIKKLTCPILIINGTKDIQVKTLDADLLHSANSNSQLKYIENMNHIFKEIKGDNNENMASYSDPNSPIMKELSTIIATFVNEL